MRHFTASAVQMRPDVDRDASHARAAALVEAAAGKGAALVALPELFCWRGAQAEELVHAESVPGPTSDFASALARRLSIHLVAGSILERTAGGGGAIDRAVNVEHARSDDERCFNTCLLFGPDGSLLARYRKIHLFDVAIGAEVQACESRTRRPGDEPACVDTELGRIGLAVCYDLRFPELFRRLADGGAEVVVMPSAFTAPTGAAHWHTLVRARAIENQCYFVAPNQYGPTLHGFSNYGHSLIVDPWGDVLAEGGDDGDAPLTAALSPDRLAEVRRCLPSLAHRRLAS